jgi:excisionase family DNA binding protein
MKKVFKTTYSDLELRQLIREEVKAVLKGEEFQVAPDDDGGYMDVNQAADFLKIAKQTLYQKTSAGTIPFIKKGKRVLFKRSELSEWLATVIPTIVDVSVRGISQNEFALLLECETVLLANNLDLMLDDYSIRWEKEGERVIITLKSPKIGSYSTDAKLSIWDNLSKVNCISTAFRDASGQLDYTEPRPLNLIGLSQ